MPTRKATAVWQGGLQKGNGTFKGQTGLGGQYNFSSRFENGEGSNPEELLAAAEAACFSMALSGALDKNGTPSTSVTTDAACTVEKVGDAWARAGTKRPPASAKMRSCQRTALRNMVTRTPPAKKKKDTPLHELARS